MHVCMDIYMSLKTSTHQLNNFDGDDSVGCLLAAICCGKGIVIRRRHFDAWDFCGMQLVN